MSLPCPDEQRLKQLIAEAFTALPGPEPAQLALVESRLARVVRRQAARQKKPWWPWLLLLATGAAAAWWGVDHYLDTNAERVDEKGPVVLTPSATPNTTQTTRQADTKAETGQNGNTMHKRNSPIIHQREQY